MKSSIFKPIVFGVLFGAAAFFVPFFLIKVIFFFALMSFIFRMFWWSKRGHHLQYRLAYADKLRNMTDEEYAVFKNNVSNNHDCHKHYGYCAPKKSKDETK
jgi:hypothetical protein